jgi:Holliday junction resolvase-like predicted endonuclease
MLISVLKLTKDGAVLTKTFNKDARLVSSFASKLLKRMESEQLIDIENGKIVADSQSRVKIAVKALCLGADVERVSDLLKWQEFEEIAVIALERNGYIVSKNVHFKHENHRFEIDVVGCKKPLVLCIDCKHWHHGMSLSALTKIVDAQVKRTTAFANSLPNIKNESECVRWKHANFTPAVLSLIHGQLKFCDNTPIIPVLQLQDFINQLPAYGASFKHITREFSHLRDNS